MGNLFRSVQEIEKCLVLTPSYLKPVEVSEGEKVTGEVIQKRTRHYGDIDISPELRTLIGLTGAVTGPERAGEIFNVSRSKASELARGIISEGAMGQKVDENLRAKVLQKKADINKMAVDLMFEGLGSVQNVEVSALPVGERIKVLKDISHIAEKTTPLEEQGNKGGNSVVIYAPRMVSADIFPLMTPEEL